MVDRLDRGYHHLESEGTDEIEEDGDEAALLVEDCETGERQCFRIDLGTGEAGPCR